MPGAHAAGRGREEGERGTLDWVCAQGAIGFGAVWASRGARDYNTTQHDATRRDVTRTTAEGNAAKGCFGTIWVQGGGGGISTGKFLPGKIPPQSLKVMGKIAPHFSMVKGKA